MRMIYTVQPLRERGVTVAVVVQSGPYTVIKGHHVQLKIYDRVL